MKDLAKLDKIDGKVIDLEFDAWTLYHLLDVLDAEIPRAFLRDGPPEDDDERLRPHAILCAARDIAKRMARRLGELPATEEGSQK